MKCRRVWLVLLAVGFVLVLGVVVAEGGPPGLSMRRRPQVGGGFGGGSTHDSLGRLGRWVKVKVSRGWRGTGDGISQVRAKWSKSQSI
jgi:hypothetical protein